MAQSAINIGFAAKAMIVACLCLCTCFSTRNVLAQPAFDLSSPAQTHTQSTGSSVTILQDGRPRVIPAGAALTSAENVAVTQVMRAGRQHLVVDAAGVASGGHFAMNLDTSSTAALTIPSGVSALVGFNASPEAFVQGLNNSGNVYAYSTTGISAGALRTDWIRNEVQGLITSALPASAVSMIAGNPTASLDLTLSATDFIVNKGTISSSGNLSIQASNTLDLSGVLQTAAKDIIVHGAPAVSLNGVQILSNGTGSGSGGNIQVWGITNVSGTILISANGGATGNGGTINLGGEGNLSVSPSSFLLSATGGSPGSLSGNGGLVAVRASNLLAVDPAAIDVAPKGHIGNGGKIGLNGRYLTVQGPLAAPAASGGGDGGVIMLAGYEVTVNAPISANASEGWGGHIVLDLGSAAINSNISAIGSAGGGTIKISGPSNGTLNLGSNTGSTFINGSLNAGLIEIRGAQTVENHGSITADQITLTSVPTVRNYGTLSGVVSVNAESVFFDSITPISIGDVHTWNSGSIVISTSSGALNIAPGAEIASAVDVTIRNMDLVNGSINIGRGAVIRAGTGVGPEAQGAVFITIGDVADAPLGTTPENVLIRKSPTGQVSFGTNGITALEPDNLIIALDNKVILSTGDRPEDAITLAGNVCISGHGIKPNLASLDLTDPAVLAKVQQLQADGYLGGMLEQTGSGVSGAVDISSDFIVMHPADSNYMNGWSVPRGVNVTLRNFGSKNWASPFSDAFPFPSFIFVEAADGNPVKIEGRQDFVNSPHVYFKAYNLTDLPACQATMQISGTLTSDGVLQTGAWGDVVVSGNIDAGGQLYVWARNAVTITGSGSLTGRDVWIGGVDNQLPSFTVVNEGVVNAEQSITLTQRGAQSLVVVGNSGLWQAGNSIQFKRYDNYNYQNRPEIIFSGNQKFLITGPNREIILGENMTARVNEGVTLDVASPNTSLVLHNSSLINNGTVDLHDSFTSGSFLVLRSYNPVVVANANGSIDLSSMRFEVSSALYVVASGDIYNSHPTSLKVPGGVGLFAGFTLSDQNWLGMVSKDTSATLQEVPNAHSSIQLAGVDIQSSPWIVVAANGGNASLGNLTASSIFSANVTVIGDSVQIGNVTVNGQISIPRTDLGQHSLHVYAAKPVVNQAGTPYWSWGPDPSPWVRPQFDDHEGTIKVGTIAAHNITINAGKGTLNLQTDSLATLQNVVGDGGTINISAARLNYPNSDANPITFDARGGVGLPGTVYLHSTVADTITVGNGAGQWQLTPLADGSPVQVYGPTVPAPPSAPPAPPDQSTDPLTPLEMPGDVSVPPEMPRDPSALPLPPSDGLPRVPGIPQEAPRTQGQISNYHSSSRYFPKFREAMFIKRALPAQAWHESIVPPVVSRAVIGPVVTPVRPPVVPFYVLPPPDFVVDTDVDDSMNAP